MSKMTREHIERMDFEEIKANAENIMASRRSLKLHFNPNPRVSAALAIADMEHDVCIDERNGSGFYGPEEPESLEVVNNKRVEMESFAREAGIL